MSNDHPILSFFCPPASAKWAAAFTAITILSSALTAVAQESAKPPERQPTDPNAVIRELVADPDFKKSVAPAENAWDFNAPNGVPGFGAIEARDDRRPEMSQTARR